MRQWSCFCREEGVQCLEPTQKTLLQFLVKRFNNRASYGTLNAYRSAILLISKDRIGNNSIISRFLKGVYRLRPATPKYAFTWDVQRVLEYLKRLYPLDNLALPDLIEKTATLLVLCMGHRAQTIASIEIRDISRSAEGLKIRVRKAVKNSGPGQF